MHVPARPHPRDRHGPPCGRVRSPAVQSPRVPRISPPRVAATVLGALLAVAGPCACGGTSQATSATLGDSLARPASAATVAVSPQPGTPDASPTTQISFLGGPGTQVSNVSVSGSQQRRSRGRAARLLDRNRRELPAQPPLPSGREGDGARARRRRRASARPSRSLIRRRSARSSSRSTPAMRTPFSTTARRRR